MQFRGNLKRQVPCESIWSMDSAMQHNKLDKAEEHRRKNRIAIAVCLSIGRLVGPAPSGEGEMRLMREFLIWISLSRQTRGCYSVASPKSFTNNCICPRAWLATHCDAPHHHWCLEWYHQRCDSSERDPDVAGQNFRNESWSYYERFIPIYECHLINSISVAGAIDWASL